MKDKSVKQVIVIRTDIKMGKGKIAAQAAHASLQSYKEAFKKNPEVVKLWENSGCEKVVLKIPALEDLLALKADIDASRIPNSLITDSGRTQLESNTITCLGIGPWYEEEIDKYTSHLKLL